MNNSSDNSYSFMRISQDNDRSRKENAGGNNDHVCISSRRKSVFVQPQITSMASISGRRRTMFIDTPNLPTKNQKKYTASSSTIVYPSGIIKKTPPTLATPRNDTLNKMDYRTVTPLSPVKTAAEGSFISSNKRKFTSDSLALKSKVYLKHVSHREKYLTSNRPSFSCQERRASLYRDESPSQRSSSSSHKRDSSSSSHKRDSSSNKRDSQSQSCESSSHRHDSSNRSASSSKRIKSQPPSPSSESSANRSVQSHNAKKKSTNNSGHPKNHEKRIRLAEYSENILRDISAAKASYKKSSETLNNSSNLGKNSEDCKGRKHKSSSMKRTPADKIKSDGAARQKDSKRNERTTTVIRDQVSLAQRKDTMRKTNIADPLWKPVLKLHRLNVDSIKKYGKNAREIIISDDSYSVYGGNGKIKIKKKKNVCQSSDNGKQPTGEPVYKANDEVMPERIKTHNFSQQTEWRKFIRDIGVQKIDEEQLEKNKQIEVSISLFNQSIKEYETALREQDEKVESLQQVINERENKVAERDRMIAERDLQIAEREQMIEERDLKIADRELKIKKYEDKNKLQEYNFQVMTRQLDTLKQSSDKLLKEHKEKLINVLKLSSTVKPSTTTSPSLPIRVKNIDELRGVLANSHTQSINAVNPTNTMRNSVSSAENFSGFPNSIGWHTTATQSSTQSSNVHRSTHPTTLAANIHDAQSTIPETSINTNTIPHQNLPRIVQRPCNERAMLPLPSSQINTAAKNVSFDRVSDFTQNGSSQTPNISHIRERAKTSYYLPKLRQLLQTPLIKSHQTFQ